MSVAVKIIESSGPTSMRVHSVGGVVLWIQSVLQVELGVLQHPLDHVLDVNGFGHVWRCHDIERDLTGVGGLCHSFDDEIAPQPLLLYRIVTLAMSKKQQVGMWTDRKKLERGKKKRNIDSRCRVTWRA